MNSSQVEKIEQNKILTFDDFAGLFAEAEQIGLKLFYESIVEKETIPYKIKNKNFVVDVMSSPAFEVSLTFENVLIEDGRHPRELLISDLRAETTEVGYRFRFVNALKQEDIVKESSFSFESVKVDVRMWNYNFNMTELEYSDYKVPWKIVYEPLDALVYKARILGKTFLNDNEKDYLEQVLFLHKFLGLYLHEETAVGYGKSMVFYNKEKIRESRAFDRELKAARELLHCSEIKDLDSSLDLYHEQPEEFFQQWVQLITRKEGQRLYDHVLWIIEKCTRDYPRLKNILPVYAGCHTEIKYALNTIFSSHRWEGSYPHYTRIERPKFIETNHIYERRYTYINEKEKQVFISFSESIVNGDLVVYVIKGSVLNKMRQDSQPVRKALDCYFADAGRRTSVVSANVVIEQGMDSEMIQDLMLNLYKTIQST